MATFHNFIKENCVGRKVRWTEINSWMRDIYEYVGIVEDTEEDCLYIRLKNGKLYCGLMKDLEMADASIEWLD